MSGSTRLILRQRSREAPAEEKRAAFPEKGARPVSCLRFYMTVCAVSLVSRNRSEMHHRAEIATSV